MHDTGRDTTLKSSPSNIHGLENHHAGRHMRKDHAAGISKTGYEML